jgi:DNA topoisomerase-1
MSAKSLTITRTKRGKDFSYSDASRRSLDAETLEWIRKLSIPPAWSGVRISRSPRSKIYVQGYDQAGRQQTIYNPSFRQKQEQLKFDRVLRFARMLPRLRRQVTKDLGRKRLNKEKVLACIVKLIDTAYFRVGNDRYAQENDSYGITTLRHKHLDVSGDTVTFDFMGKSGQHHVKRITDKQVARIVKRLDELPGYEIFRYQDDTGTMHDIHSGDVNEYIKRHMGEEFSAKDFRTWGGTLLATTELLKSELTNDKKVQQKTLTNVIKNVSKRLGNTPAIAKQSYIDPRVIAAYIDSKELGRVQNAMKNMKPRKYMTRDEQSVLKLLEAK